MATEPSMQLDFIDNSTAIVVATTPEHVQLATEQKRKESICCGIDTR